MSPSPSRGTAVLDFGSVAPPPPPPAAPAATGNRNTVRNGARGTPDAPCPPPG
ncbi:MAG: hypothetical protein IPO58_17320 [Betaproteobacteria bacterium]|nr:hypothetical protein [Betaproteobacteria bacterium]